MGPQIDGAGTKQKVDVVAGTVSIGKQCLRQGKIRARKVSKRDDNRFVGPSSQKCRNQQFLIAGDVSARSRVLKIREYVSVDELTQIDLEI